MKQYKTLREVRKYLNEIPNINSGGCGFSALAMFLWLEKEGKANSETKIVFTDGLEYDYVLDNMEAISSGNYFKADAANHVYMYHNKRYYDSHNYHVNPKNLQHGVITEIPNTIVLTFMTHSLSLGCWNKMFDRKWVSEIEYELGISFDWKYS